MGLREHLSWCECDGRIFLLDLAADRYFKLEPQLDLAFRYLLAGTASQDDLARLGRAGLLGAGDPDAQARAAFPRGDLAGQLPVRRGGLIGALHAEARAAWLLRRKGLMAIRSLAAQRPIPASEDEAMGIARGIAGAFIRSGLLLGTSGRCLVRAIACHARCNAFGLQTQLVLGIRSDPFQAHAWVQLGSELLVGDYEQARAYVPILVVSCRAAS